MLCDSCPFQLTQACFGAHHVAQLGGAHCALERNTPRCWAGGFPGTPVRSGRLGCCSSLLFRCWSAAQPAHYWKWSVDVFNCYVWIAHFSLQFCCFCCTNPRALSLDAYVYNLCVFPSVILKCPSFPPVTFFFFFGLKVYLVCYQFPCVWRWCNTSLRTPSLSTYFCPWTSNVSPAGGSQLGLAFYAA